MDNFDLRKYLAEGRLLKENTNPIWTIGADEDDADISDAGLEYIRAVSTIIDKALPDASIEDQIASMDVINNFWHDEARKNAKGSEPEEIKVSAIDFADSVIEHYKDVLMDKDIKENKITNNKMENFDLRKYLAEGRLYENTDEEIKAILTKSYPGAYSEGDFKEIINLYNTKYRDYKDSYGKLDGVEQAAFKFNYANNRDIETGMKAGSKSSTSIDFPEMEDEFEGAMSSMSISKEEYLQDIIDASADEIVSDSYFEIKNAVEQEIYSKNEAVKLAKEWARKKLSTLAEGKLLKEKEQGYTLYTTNVEYDNGKTGYMYQLVNSEDGEENEIGFDQLYFVGKGDASDPQVFPGKDFKDFDQGSYQEEELSAEEAMKIYNELK